jgi:transposase-like protein
MQDYFIFDVSELMRIGLVCPDCRTEAIFDLTKDQTAITSRDCPGCGKSEFVRTFKTPAGRDFDWVKWFLSAINRDDKDIGIRLYFERR